MKLLRIASVLAVLAGGVLVFLWLFQTDRKREREGEITGNQAVYKGRTTAQWRSVMNWPDFPFQFVACDFPLLVKPDAEALPVLVELLRDDEFRVQLTAIACLRELGDKARPAIPHLCQILDDQAQGKKPEAMVVHGTLGLLNEYEKDAAVIVPRFTKLLSDPDLYTRLIAARSYFHITKKREPCVEVARAVLRHPDANEYTRSTAVKLLKEVGGPTSEIVRLLAFVLDNDPVSTVRLKAAESLGKFGKAAAPALPALLRRLDDKDSCVRNEATEAILRVGDPPRELLPHALRELKADYVSPSYLRSLQLWKPIPNPVVAAVESLVKRPGLQPSVLDAATEVLKVLRSEKHVPKDPPKK